MYMRVDHAEPNTKIPAAQVSWVFRDPQASSCKDANIIVIKVSPLCITHNTWLLFWIYIFILKMIVH
jgi:hypothetical protein